MLLELDEHLKPRPFDPKRPVVQDVPRCVSCPLLCIHLRKASQYSERQEAGKFACREDRHVTKLGSGLDSEQQCPPT